MIKGIIEKVNKSFCKMKIFDNRIITGFFCKIKFPDIFNILYSLITDKKVMQESKKNKI